jgi:16S rRNA (cytosine1402-N4)-methyltransferase
LIQHDHTSVLPEKVWRFLRPASPGELFIDATLGEGGHTELFLSRAKDLKAVGIDADSSILEVAKRRLGPYNDRVRFFNIWFNVFFREYPLRGERPDKILFDLGISSFHYESSSRGFSFSRDEYLDMRIGGELETSAFDIVNNYPETELANILYEYGEERYSRKIAAAITAARGKKSIEKTSELRGIVERAVPPEYRRGKIHAATKTFQALRIAVNGELVRLSSALRDSLQVLKPGGRLAVISFHSLEDRIVKHFFKEKSRSCTCPPELPRCECGRIQRARILTKKPVTADEDETAENPRGRSAKLRVLEKIEDEV